MTPDIAEGRINDAIAIKLQRDNYNLCSGRFGDEHRGCALRCYMEWVGDRRSGESAVSYASRAFKTNEDNIWALVNGFDGKPNSQVAYGNVKNPSPRAVELMTWYDAGVRIAERWKGYIKQW